MIDNEKKAELSPDMLEDVNGGLFIKRLETEDDEEDTDDIAAGETAAADDLRKRSRTGRRLGRTINKL